MMRVAGFLFFINSSNKIEDAWNLLCKLRKILTGNRYIGYNLQRISLLLLPGQNIAASLKGPMPSILLR